MEIINLYENVKNEDLETANSVTQDIVDYLNVHKTTIIAAKLYPHFITVEKLLEAYSELQETMYKLLVAGQMALESELITRDIDSINPDKE